MLMLQKFYKGHLKCRFFTLSSQRRFYSGEKTFYEILGVGQNATDKEIKAAYKKLSKKYHPDTTVERNAHEKFVAIAEAYQTLSKPLSRKEYDLKLNRTQKPDYRTRPTDRWHGKNYGEWTKEEEKQFREYFYREHGMGSETSPKIKNFLWMFSGLQIVFMAVFGGLILFAFRLFMYRREMSLAAARHQNHYQQLYDREKRNRRSVIYPEHLRFYEMQAESRKNSQKEADHDDSPTVTQLKLW